MKGDPLSFNKDYVQSVLQQEFTKSGKKLFLLSDEGFSARNQFLIKNYAYQLYSICPNAHIIIFIRNQEAMLASMYSQYIKSNGGTFSLKKYLFGHPSMTRLTNSVSFNMMSLLKYDSLIKLYKRLFGEGNVSIYLFEDFTQDPKLFCRNLSARFGFEVDLDDLSYNKKNEGISVGLIPLQRFLNCFTARWRYEKYYIINIPYFHKISYHIIKRLNNFRIFGGKIRIKKLLTENQFNSVLDFYRESNRNLISEHGLKDIEKYGYPL